MNKDTGTLSMLILTISDTKAKGSKTAHTTDDRTARVPYSPSHLSVHNGQLMVRSPFELSAGAQASDHVSWG